MNQRIETVIIGGGQAGMATSHHLARRGREHVVVERAVQAANVWRNDRWDSFTLVTPNWSFRLPGAEYQGNAPEGYLKRDEIVSRLEQHITAFDLPIQYGVHINTVERRLETRDYVVSSEGATWEARNVVVATGLFQRPRRPSFGADIAAESTQLYSGQYRKPDMLPPGAVRIVGSAQSGCQIAEELYQSGRRVYLCVGGAGLCPLAPTPVTRTLHRNRKKRAGGCIRIRPLIG